MSLSDTLDGDLNMSNEGFIAKIVTYLFYNLFNEGQGGQMPAEIFLEKIYAKWSNIKKILFVTAGHK